MTTKLRNADQGYDAALSAFESSRKALGVDVVDLYLIHWPVPAKDLYVETWHALEKLLAEGAVRAIGVSNFLPEHLRRVVAESETVPAVNQVEVHPTFQQRATQERDPRGRHRRRGLLPARAGPATWRTRRSPASRPTTA